MTLFASEAERLERFPVAKKQIFVAIGAYGRRQQCTIVETGKSRERQWTIGGEPRSCVTTPVVPFAERE